MEPESPALSRTEPAGRRGAGWLWWAIPLALVVYVLSIGPADAILVKTQSKGYADVYEIVYAPLIWLAGHTVLGELLEWYVRMWVVAERSNW